MGGSSGGSGGSGGSGSVWSEGPPWCNTMGAWICRMDWKNTWEYNIEKKGEEALFFVDSSLDSWNMEDCALLGKYPEVEDRNIFQETIKYERCVPNYSTNVANVL